MADKNDILRRAPLVAFAGKNEDAMVLQLGKIRGRRG
ncbi:hypothetical protein FHS26_002689 [Rhizobium pisi]|uniref:Uncharacterized protein n=1 Tax=Rhizobium pisi TaxID=574561 RepID=A0A7W5BL52_9HYPH|nr:hypothetical protein [Rhizobium pisi]